MIDGGEDRLGHRLDEAGHEQEHQEHERRRDEAGELGLRPGLEGHGRPRAAGAHREAGEQARRQVRRADPRELLVAVHLVLRPGREATRGRDRVADRDQRDPDRGHEAGAGCPRSARREGRDREPLGQDADHGDAVRRRGRGRPRARSPTTTATRIPGIRGAAACSPRMMARLRSPIAERPRVRQAVRAPGRTLPPRATRPLASVENPNSFGSWPMKMTTARPARYPVRTGFESRSATKPSRASARADGDDPDEEREHPGQGDRHLLAAGGERQDGGGDHRPERRIRARGPGSATARRGRTRRGRRRSCTAR